MLPVLHPLVSDHKNSNRIEASVSRYKYPQEDFNCKFSNANENLF